MKAMIAIACAMSIAIVAAVATIRPATASPIGLPNIRTVETGIDIQPVSDRRWDKRKNSYRGKKCRRSNGKCYRSKRNSHYRGDRNYRYRGDRYRGGLFLGGIIGGALLNQGSSSYGGSSHVEWCLDRYRSYRVYDNTFQPYHGRRKQCYSPYNR